MGNIKIPMMDKNKSEENQLAPTTLKIKILSRENLPKIK
jgi:hypothetical protein